jgi:hypothetical protein
MKVNDDSAAYGMELRDYFAAAAMQGLLAGATDGRHPNVWELARDAYKVAEAMMLIREER